MKRNIVKFLKVVFTVFTASILLTIVVDALEIPDGVSLKFWQKTNDSKCSQDMVAVISPEGDFCIDKYEVSPGSKCEYETINKQQDTSKNLDIKNCAPVSEPNKFPWTFVTRGQAQALCARAGKRLPRASEWYYASLGTPDISNNWAEKDCQVKNNWAEQPGLTGSGLECVSGAGAMDMIGNVWEWVDESVRNGEYHGQKLPVPGYVSSLDNKGVPLDTNAQAVSELEDDYLWLKTNGPRQVSRGGYYDNGNKAGVNAWYMVNDSVFSGVGVGFRCVK